MSAVVARTRKGTDGAGDDEGDGVDVAQPAEEAVAVLVSDVLERGAVEVGEVVGVDVHGRLAVGQLPVGRFEVAGLDGFGLDVQLEPFDALNVVACLE